MSDKLKDRSSLPMNTLKDIPEAKSDANKITGLIKDGGHVTGYQLEDGQIVGKEEAIRLAKEGGIRGVGISTRKGNEYLKSLPDETEDNNLGNLPTIPVD